MVTTKINLIHHRMGLSTRFISLILLLPDSVTFFTGDEYSIPSVSFQRVDNYLPINHDLKLLFSTHCCKAFTTSLRLLTQLKFQEQILGQSFLKRPSRSDVARR